MTAPGPSAQDARPVGARRLMLPDPAATRALGARLGALLRPGDCVALSGDLGAGKSELARAAIRARLGDPRLEVPSPTFTLVQTYEAADLEIWHVDLYRLERPEDVLELGVEEALAEAALLVEWPDRLGPDLPAARLDLRLEAGPGDGRTALIGDPAGAWADRLETLAPGADGL